LDTRTLDQFFPSADFQSLELAPITPHTHFSSLPSSGVAISKSQKMSLSESWLSLEAATGGRQPMRGPPHDARAKFAGLIQMLAPLFPPSSNNVGTRNGDVDGIGYRIYTPKGNDGGLPLVVFSEHQCIRHWKRRMTDIYYSSWWRFHSRRSRLGGHSLSDGGRALQNGCRKHRLPSIARGESSGTCRRLLESVPMGEFLG
jgi:hypothetical protein